MLPSYQSVYVVVYRWIAKNFGLGSLPQFKSLFNVNFLLIIVLTNAMLFTKLLLRMPGVSVNINSVSLITLGVVFLLLTNYFMFLNNKRLSYINKKLAYLSHRNVRVWSVVLLINVIAACSFCIFK